MTSVQSQGLLDRIRERHGASNVSWPVIFYDPGDLHLNWLTFETNQHNSTNSGLAKRFFERGQLEEFAINYLPPQRYILPLTSAKWPDPPGQQIIASEYFSTYDYLVSSQNSNFNTIDIDYAWRTQTGEYRALEISTFWKPMSTLEYSKHLVGQFIKKRAAVKNAHQFKILADVAVIQEITYRLVFVNVLGKESNEINTSGNVFVIPITCENASRMHAGQFPLDFRFLPFQEWLKSL